MTAHEKAVNAINGRLERLQGNLREAKEETAQQFLVQALVVTVGAADVLSDYIKMVGRHAQRRHAELKGTNEALAARHAELLKSGQELLEKLRATPTDRGLRREIERAQRDMAVVQKSLRRGANALQRDVGPSLAMIDPMSVNVRRLSETENAEGLKRLLKSVGQQLRELYHAQPGLPAKDVIDTAAWEKAALADLDRAAGFHDAYARAGYQVNLAFEWMTMAVSENPPRAAAEAAQRGVEAVATRLKEITTRITSKA